MNINSRFERREKLKEPNRKLTSFSLFNLERQVERTDGKVDGLRIDGADLAEEVQYQLALVAHQTRQQLWNPVTK